MAEGRRKKMALIAANVPARTIRAEVICKKVISAYGIEGDNFLHCAALGAAKSLCYSLLWARGGDEPCSVTGRIWRLKGRMQRVKQLHVTGNRISDHGFHQMIAWDDGRVNLRQRSLRRSGRLPTGVPIGKTSMFAQMPMSLPKGPRSETTQIGRSYRRTRGLLPSVTAPVHNK